MEKQLRSIPAPDPAPAIGSIVVSLPPYGPAWVGLYTGDRDHIGTPEETYLIRNVARFGAVIAPVVRTARATVTRCYVESPEAVRRRAEYVEQYLDILRADADAADEAIAAAMSARQEAAFNLTLAERIEGAGE